MKGGMQQLMKQANQMQRKMKELQDDLATREYEGSAGGGAVSVRLRGETELISLKIADESVKDDLEMLEDLILTATNEVLKKAKEESSKEMEKISGGMSMPGLF